MTRPTQRKIGHTEITENTEKARCVMTDNELTYEVRGAIYDVYKTLGPGLLESVYEEALSFELQKRGFRVERQVEVPIMYQGNRLKTLLRLDMLVENQIIVELKSVEELQKVHYKQLLTYLRLMDKQVGLLVNFNCDNILSNIKRVIN
jgi:GxxExxY protein